MEALGQHRLGARPLIPADFITEWRSQARVGRELPGRAGSRHQPGPGRDLRRRRACADALAFRGGTALYKLYLTPRSALLRGHRPRPEDRRAHRPDHRPAPRATGFVARRTEAILQGRACDPHLPIPFGGPGTTSPASEGGDQLQRALHCSGLREQGVRCSLSLVLGKLTDLDLRPRRAARHQAARPLPAQEEPGPVRPLVGLEADRGRSRSCRPLFRRVPQRRWPPGL